MTTHPAVTGAAVLASLIVGGGVYTARHSTSDAALTASADARRAIDHTAAYPHRIKLLSYHPPRVRHVARSARPSSPGAVAVAVPAAAPQVVAVPAQTPVTSTSPTAGGDDSESSGGGDD